MLSEKPIDTPVLIIGYNRVDLLAEIIDEISLYDRQVFVHLDGPRGPQDLGQFECRDFVDSIKVNKKYRNITVKIQEQNLGCKNGVRAAIDWVFSQCDKAIILEDDVRFNSSFLSFADVLLDEYRDSTEIFAICGYSPLRGTDYSFMPQSYFISRNLFIWGWATWKSRWHNIDLDLKLFNPSLDIRRLGTLREYNLNRHFSRFWLQKIHRVLNGLDTWDIQLLYLMWYRQMKSIVPMAALTTNIGFDNRATHTKFIPSIPLAVMGEIEIGSNSNSQPIAPFPFERGAEKSIDYLIDKMLINLVTQTGLNAEIANFFIRAKRVALRMELRLRKFFCC